MRLTGFLLILETYEAKMREQKISDINL